MVQNDAPSPQLTHDISTSKTSTFPFQISSRPSPNSCPSPTPCPSPTQKPLISSTQIPHTFYSTDIGQYIGNTIDDYTKCQLLESH
ncbi:hypothetical protein QTP88_006591 [Uroleucon formosanum]